MLAPEFQGVFIVAMLARSSWTRMRILPHESAGITTWNAGFITDFNGGTTRR
jgi:hypothetical protein